jgi:3-deoxy-D-arabino-heptulosonate 7-phosphate (DAHP) synthase
MPGILLFSVSLVSGRIEHCNWWWLRPAAVINTIGYAPGAETTRAQTRGTAKRLIAGRLHRILVVVGGFCSTFAA